LARTDPRGNYLNELRQKLTSTIKPSQIKQAKFDPELCEIPPIKKFQLSDITNSNIPPPPPFFNFKESVKQVKSEIKTGNIPFTKFVTNYHKRIFENLTVKEYNMLASLANMTRTTGGVSIGLAKPIGPNLTKLKEDHNLDENATGVIIAAMLLAVTKIEGFPFIKQSTAHECLHIESAFYIDKEERSRGKKLILLDDPTTYDTSEECTWLQRVASAESKAVEYIVVLCAAYQVKPLKASNITSYFQSVNTVVAAKKILEVVSAIAGALPKICGSTIDLGNSDWIKYHTAACSLPNLSKKLLNIMGVHACLLIPESQIKLINEAFEHPYDKSLSDKIDRRIIPVIAGALSGLKCLPDRWFQHNKIKGEMPSYQYSNYFAIGKKYAELSTTDDEIESSRTLDELMGFVGNSYQLSSDVAITANPIKPPAPIPKKENSKIPEKKVDVVSKVTAASSSTEVSNSNKAHSKETRWDYILHYPSDKASFTVKKSYADLPYLGRPRCKEVYDMFGDHPKDLSLMIKAITKISNKVAGTPISLPKVAAVPHSWFGFMMGVFSTSMSNAFDTPVIPCTQDSFIRAYKNLTDTHTGKFLPIVIEVFYESAFHDKRFYDFIDVMEQIVQYINEAYGLEVLHELDPQDLEDIYLALN